MKRVLRYATGYNIPDDAIYLWSCKNGKMSEGMRALMDKPEEYEFVWHYFLVDDKLKQKG